MIYIIGVLWLLYSGFWFYILNDAVKNESEALIDACGQEAFNKYLKNYLIHNAIVAIIAPVVHLWQLFFWIMKKIVFGAIDLIGNVVKVEKGKK
jgi:hypothetical protein